MIYSLGEFCTGWKFRLSRDLKLISKRISRSAFSMRPEIGEQINLFNVIEKTIFQALSVNPKIKNFINIITSITRRIISLPETLSTPLYLSPLLSSSPPYPSSPKKKNSIPPRTPKPPIYSTKRNPSVFQLGLRGWNPPISCHQHSHPRFHNFRPRRYRLDRGCWLVLRLRYGCRSLRLRCWTGGVSGRMRIGMEREHSDRRRTYT